MTAAVMAIGATIWSLRGDAIDDAVRDTGNIASILAEQTTRSVQSIDLIATEISERIAALGIRSASDFQRMLQGEDVFALLRERLARLPQADVIALIDEEGNLLNSTRNWPATFVNYSDLEHFRVSKTDEYTRLYASTPVVSRLSGERMIYFARRVNGADGSFIGLIAIGVHTKYFQHIYNSITSLTDQTFLFARQDGTILVYHPDKQGRIGSKLPLSPQWYRAVDNGGGNYRSLGAFTGQARVIAVRPLRDYPLVVSVAFSEAAALEGWKRRALLIGIGTMLVVLCAIFLLRALVHQFRRLLNSEASLCEGQTRLAEKSMQLEHANKQVDVALNNISQGLCMFDNEDRLVVCNERYLRMYNLPPDIIKPGCSLRTILHYRKKAGNFELDPDEYIANMHARLSQGKSTHATMRLADGRFVSQHNQAVPGGGWVATHDDITERQRSEAQIAHMAHHDALTDLANRMLFREKMDLAYAHLRSKGQGFAVLLFDLDLFKTVNDSLGHPVGDSLLCLVAHRLRDLIGGTDTVARLGGDEFAILQPNDANDRESLIILANQLLESLSAPYEIDGNQIVIGTSIGIAIAPDHGEEPGQLLKNADLALYKAKSEGRNCYRFFEPEMDQEARLRRALEVDLRNATTRGEFEIHYQDVINIETRDVCSVEALVRWMHPQQGLISPNKFIPLAEEIGLIIPVGEWILRKACSDAAGWPSHIKLAVNLSPVQFRNGDLVNIVTEALVASGLPPSRLELEVTETVLLQKNARNLAILHQLKSLGVDIVLDDFGTGYSSLSYLRMFPFDKIKIDQSFVAELSTRADCAAIVCALTSLGRGLQINTTAEGVETQEQFELLRAAGCTQAQGYLFSRPRPASQLDFLRRGDDKRTEEAA